MKIQQIQQFLFQPLHPKTVRQVLYGVYAVMLVITWHYASLVMEFQRITPTKLIHVFSETKEARAAGPQISVTSGIVSLANGDTGGTFSPSIRGPVTFGAPAAATPFTGSFTSALLAASPVNSNLSQVDAGDAVRFAIIVENTGSNVAYDIVITDTFPVGFTAPADVNSLNLLVYDAAGNDLKANTTGGLFGKIVKGGTTNGTDTSITMNLAGGLPAANGTGTNILVITYDITLAGTVEPLQAISNLGAVTNFASTASGANLATPAASYRDTATVTIRDVSITLVMDTTSGMDNNGETTSPNFTLGEAVLYELVVNAPEGTLPGVSLDISIPEGLTYYLSMMVMPRATASSGPGGCEFPPGQSWNADGTLPGTATHTPPINARESAGSGVDMNIVIDGDIIVAADNVGTNNTFCIPYAMKPINVNSSNLGHTAILHYGTSANSSGSLAQTGFTLVRPNLTATKTVNTPTGNRGDILIYTLRVEYGASTSPGHLISIADPIDANFTLNTDWENDGLDNNGDGQIDEVNEGSIMGYAFGILNMNLNGQIITSENTFKEFKYKVTVAGAVAASTVISNTATITYNDGPGPGTIPSQYNTQASANFTVRNVTVGKVISATSNSDTGISKFNGSQTDLAIGEQVTYRTTLTIPKANISNLVFTDTMPSVFRVDSATIISNNTGAVPNATQITDSNSDSVNDLITITFPTMNNSAGNGTETVVIDTVATVMTNATNSDGSQKTATSSVTFTGITGGAVTSSVITDIVRPVLAVTAVVSPTSDVMPRNTVQYTFTITNRGGANSTNARFTSTLTSGATFSGGSDTYTTSYPSIPPNETKTISLSAVVGSPSSATVVNTATVTDDEVSSVAASAAFVMWQSKSGGTSSATLRQIMEKYFPKKTDEMPPIEKETPTETEKTSSDATEISNESSSGSGGLSSSSETPREEQSKNDEFLFPSKDSEEKKTENNFIKISETPSSQKLEDEKSQFPEIIYIKRKEHMNDLENIGILPQLGKYTDSNSQEKIAALFPDVKPDHTYYKSAVALYDQGIIQGYKDGSLKLDAYITREEVAKIIVRASQSKIPGKYEAGFRDAREGQWYIPYINYVADEKIMEGYKGNTFGVGKKITVAETMKVIVRGFQLSPNITPNSGKGHWAQNYYDFLRSKNLVSSDFYDWKKWDKPITRGQIFDIIYRTLFMEDGGRDEFVDTIRMTIPVLDMKDVLISRTLLSDASVWARDLARGGGFYEVPNENGNGTLIIFAHASLNQNTKNPNENLFQPLVDSLKIGDIIELKLNEKTLSFSLESREKAHEDEVEKIQNAPKDIGLILFTSAEDPSERWIFMGKAAPSI